MDGERVLDDRSTYLSRGHGDPDAPFEPGPSAPEPGSAPGAVWTLAGHSGRRYGPVSGDLNPIHLHPLSDQPLEPSDDRS